jgi:hypothetical protein
VPAAAIAAAVAVPAWQLGGLLDTREQAGGLRAIGRVCDRLPKRAVVWTADGSGEARLLQTVHVYCGVPVAQSLPDQPPWRVRELARRMASRGRPLYVMATHRSRLIPLVGSEAAIGRPVVFHPNKLEESVDHRPRRVARIRIAFYMARLE